MSIYVDVKIKKPLFGTFCYVRETYIDQAIKQNKLLKVIIPQGYGLHSPSMWRETGKKMEKVFLLPDCPMILWGNHVKIVKEKVGAEAITETFKKENYEPKLDEPRTTPTEGLNSLKAHMISMGYIKKPLPVIRQESGENCT